MTLAAWIVLALLAGLLIAQTWHYVGRCDAIRAYYMHQINLRDREIEERDALLARDQHQRRVLNEIPVSRLIGDTDG